MILLPEPYKTSFRRIWAPKVGKRYPKYSIWDVLLMLFQIRLEQWFCNGAHTVFKLLEFQRIP